MDILDMVLEFAKKPKVLDRVTIADKNSVNGTFKGVVLEIFPPLEGATEYRVALEQQITDQDDRLAPLQSLIAQARQNLAPTSELEKKVLTIDTVDTFWDNEILEIDGVLTVEEALLHVNSHVRNAAIKIMQEPA